MPIEKVCAKCNSPFKIKASHAPRRKFCSDACRIGSEIEFGRPAAHKAAVDFPCKQCGKTFSYKPSYLAAYRKKHNKDPNYCSIRCFGIARRYSDDMIRGECLQCGNPMPIRRRPGGTINAERGLCSTNCRSLFRRLSYQNKNPGQQITRRVGRWGYVRLIIPGKNGEPSRDVLEHRYVMEQTLGRDLLSDETVHHINGVRADNRPENLELFSNRHGPGQRVVDKVQYAIEILTQYPDFARQAGYVLHKAHINGAPPNRASR